LNKFSGKSYQAFFINHKYQEQVEQLWLVQLPQPQEELVILPFASLEAKEKVEINRFSLP